MGSMLKILHMISIILISSSSAHILFPAVSSSASVLNAEENYFNGVDGLKDLHFIEVEKVSGEDDNAEKEPFILEKFRALLGLKSFTAGRTPYNGGFENGSPSPSPSPSIDAEAQAPAPVPAPPLHAHAHPPHHPKQIPPAHKTHRESSRGKGRVKKILVAVLISTGTTSVICLLGFIWFCLKFRKPKKRSERTVGSHGKEKVSRGRSNNGAAGKVSINPGLDLIYLDSIESSLDQQGTCLKHSSPTPNISVTSNQNSISPALLESEELGQKPRKLESDHVWDEEIVSVHEDDAESGEDQSNGGSSYSCREKIVPIEAQFSDNDDDDESFHSFCESHSSNVRLSNASAGSFRDAAEVFSPNVYKNQPSLPSSSNNLLIPPATPDLIPAPPPKMESFPSPIFPKTPEQEAPCSSESCQKVFPPPPPPPPPPRPPQFSSKASCSSAMPNFSALRNSDSSSGSSQTPQRDLQPSSHKPPNPPPPPGAIPPPPCPPPFISRNSNPLKTPPPPSQLSHFIPLGKDGAPLPKLKPLHWDKVRAAPNRSTVWDKMRSSSFE